MYVYIIECEDGSLYTGIAKNVVQRLRQHYHHLSGCAKLTLSHQIQDGGLISVVKIELSEITNIKE